MRYEDNLTRETHVFIDPALQIISDCLEEMFEEYDIELMSSECNAKVF